MAELSESEILQSARDLQGLIENNIKAGDKSLTLASLNIHLKRGIAVAGNLNPDENPDKQSRKWQKSTDLNPKVEPVAKPAAVVEDDDKFLAELKGKALSVIEKNNKTSLLTIAKSINEREQDDAKKLVFTEDSTKPELAKLIFDYLNPKVEPVA